jgi:hypothetical protein
MTDQDFFDRACISMRQAYGEEAACRVAKNLLDERNKHRIKEPDSDLAERNKHRSEPNDLKEHIMEVDHLQAEHYRELRDKVEQLELKVAHLTALIERMPGWVNQPIYPGPVTVMPSPVVTPGNPGTGDPIPSIPNVWCGTIKDNANQ